MSRPRKGMGAVFALVMALVSGWVPAPAAAQSTVEYIHTDLLGSIAVVTDATANVIERREYEPYGVQLTPTVQDGPGYTGDVQDKATGLVYMQQRYYDPICGCFLSVDPVTAYGNPILSFNRYRYANSNPYSFMDPDGMDAIYVSDRLTVVIPVHFEGSMASEGMKAEVISRMASVRTDYMGINSFQVVEANAPGAGVNRLILEDRFNRSFVPAGEGTWGGAGGSYIHINCAVGGDCAGKSVHDLLHAAGVGVDGYIDSGSFESRVFVDYKAGYEDKHIMANPRGTQVKLDEAAQILRSNSTRTMSSRQFQGIFGVDGRISANKLEEELKGN